MKNILNLINNVLDSIVTFVLLNPNFIQFSFAIVGTAAYLAANDIIWGCVDNYAPLALSPTEGGLPDNINHREHFKNLVDQHGGVSITDPARIKLNDDMSAVSSARVSLTEAEISEKIKKIVAEESQSTSRRRVVAGMGVIVAGVVWIAAQFIK